MRTISGRKRLTIKRIGNPRSLSLPATRSASRIALTSGVVTTIASVAPAIALRKPRFDAGRTVDQHVVGQLGRLRRQSLANCASVTRLCRAFARPARIDERLEALVLDQRLAQLAAAFDDLDQVEDDALLEAEHEIEVAQADIGVDQRDASPRLASAAPRLAVVVVLPTPPLPEVTTMRRVPSAAYLRSGPMGDALALDAERFFRFRRGARTLLIDRDRGRNA